MTPIAQLFLLLSSLLLIALPRQWAPVPLLLGASYMTLGQSLMLGPLTFTVIRILIAVGFLRILIRGERLEGGLNLLDWIILLWGLWAVTGSIFVHSLEFKLGMAYNTVGIYFLFRIFTSAPNSLSSLLKAIPFILAPVAVEMLIEQLTSRNLFAALGGVPEQVIVRNGRLRAQGPFAHPILAGTVAAALLPMLIPLWSIARKRALLGIVACLTMILACASSGPVVSLLAGICAMYAWRLREYLKNLRIAAVIAYIVLELFMKAPAYFLIARIDLAGGSTGWHRAELIRQGFSHLNEWWLAGTDYTRHWMVTGVTWSRDHSDITSQYIYYGVFGGLPLMLLFIAALWVGFHYVGRHVRVIPNTLANMRIVGWGFGAALFAQAASCISVYYYDQSFTFLYLNLALIASLPQHTNQVLEPKSSPNTTLPVSD